MSLVINTNVASLNAQRQLLQSGNALDQATERLSSGNRINSAKDDAAGLAIANRMTSQVRGLNQAVRNANDGISMVQTAEGALQEATNILQRMRELSNQAANGIYEDVDRERLNSETQLLKVELDRIAKETTFNGKSLLDGTLQDTLLQVGSQQNQTISISIGSFSTSSLGGSSGDVVGEATTGGVTDLQALDGTDTIAVNGTTISDLSATTTLNDALKIMNADLEGKGAQVGALAELTAGSAGSGVLRAGTDSLTIAVEDGDGNDQSYVITGTNSMDELVAKINDQTGVEASLDDRGRLVLTAEGATSITATASGVAGGSGEEGTGFAFDGDSANFSLVFNDTSADKKGVTITLADGATAANVDNAALGLDLNDANGNIEGATVAAQALNEGDLIINGVEIGAVTAGGTPAEQLSNMINAINEKSSETGVVAFAGGGTSNLALRSSSGDEISVEYGSTADAADVLSATGLQERNATSGVGSVASIDISTAAGAQKALGILDEAIDQVGQTRADLGAVNNRLEFTVANLSNISEKTSAARSRIMDADFAAETANLSKSQVLQQAAQAMLAQANARPQQVLQLLQ